MASQPQTTATGPSTMPSTKNPATAQMTPMIPSVARSGPLRDPVRPRERGCLRDVWPKPAIINSLDLRAGRTPAGSGSVDPVTPARAR
ncbi:hypothetical protein GCM10010358_02330 [Streptomyces minutiscleroticus]|uniref:Uncharacterized protein n=1 Tax=Streptomyces minutiscleroticus TaxID=68238 RepID=A0A918K6C8_9ACTN|nr:hypothetical protein GCM10010358_02330 [Streptomyces minutiscleroticus]